METVRVEITGFGDPERRFITVPVERLWDLPKPCTPWWNHADSDPIRDIQKISDRYLENDPDTYGTPTVADLAVAGDRIV